MSNEGAQQPQLGVKDLLGSVWFLFVCYSIAAWLGYVPVPQFARDAWDSFNGNEKEKFTALVDEMPLSQQHFVKAVLDARTAYNRAENELAQGAQRIDRQQAICAVNNGYTDGEWIGFVDTLSSNGDGLGIVRIKVAPFTTVGTWNNSFSDIGQHTLLRADEQPFVAAKTLKEGDKVVFTGRFFESEVDCIEESSATLDGSMTQPNFIVKFNNLRAAP